MAHIVPETPTSRHVPLSRSKVLVLAAAGLLSGLFFSWFTIRTLSGHPLFGPPVYHGTVLQTPLPVGSFTLTAHDGNRVSLADFRGKVVLLYFGYTYCPDVCPATMSALAKAMDALKPGEREQLQVLMVTVDPERDTAMVLQEYLAHFDPAFLGLTGTEDEIAAAAAPFGIYIEKGEGSVETGYLVNHTATVSAVDRAGRLRIVFPFGTPGEDIATDVRRLLKE